MEFFKNMMEKEIIETYYFNPADFDERGRKYEDGMSFRDVVKEYEREFHNCHSTEYALNLYANYCTMALFAKSNDAAPFLIYGMELTRGKSFDAIFVGSDWKGSSNWDNFQKKLSKMGIDVVFTDRPENGISTTKIDKTKKITDIER